MERPETRWPCQEGEKVMAGEVKEVQGEANQKAPSAKQEQAPQAYCDQHGPGYDNDVPNNWLRGNGQDPCFDKHKAGK
jgi:hypothetical protein